MRKRRLILSEQFDTPVIVRLSTRVSHSQSAVELCDREEHELAEYKKNPQKFVMMPGNAIRRHPAVEERMRAIAEYAETSPLNRLEINDTGIALLPAVRLISTQRKPWNKGVIPEARYRKPSSRKYNQGVRFKVRNGLCYRGA